VATGGSLPAALSSPSITFRDCAGHLPVTPARTTRHIIERVYRAAGHPPRLFAAGRTTLRALGLVQPPLREYLHTLYQFTDPWIVDDSKFRHAFDTPAAPVGAALADTLTWYRDHETTNAA